MGKPINVVDLEVVYRSEEQGTVVLALDRINLDIPANQFVCIVGRSGCGKTTFLNCIDGSVTPAAGSVSIDGKEIAGPGPDRAMVFQQASLFPWSTAGKNAAYGLELQNLEPSDAARRIKDLFSLVGLDGYEDYYPAQLSGGMQQRVNLARALALDPQILLLDEPFGALDAQTREFMQGELTRIWQSNPKTAVFITHDISEAIFLADRVIVFSSRPGRVRADIPIDLPRPRTLEMRRSNEFIEHEKTVWGLLHDFNSAAAAPVSCVAKQSDAVGTGETAALSQTPAAGAHTGAEDTPRKSVGVHPRRSAKSLRRFMLGLVSVVLVFAAWEVAARTGFVNISFSSAPSDIIRSAVALFQTMSFWNDMATSALELAIGFLIASVAGILIGIIVGWYEDVDAILAPFITGLYATPRISLAPLLIVWLGIGLGSKVALVVLSAIFPILINTATGIRTTDRHFVRVARSFGADDWTLFKTVAIPAAIPYIVSGLRLGSGLGIIGVVVAELIAGNAGIGYRMLLAGQTFQVAEMFVCLLVFTAAGMVLSWAFTKLERRFDAWRRI